MRPGARLRGGVLLFVLVALVGGVAVVHPTVFAGGPPDGAPAPTTDAPTTAEEAGVTLVQVDDRDQRLWAYTSRQRDFETATLPVNLVVMEDARTTRRVLAADEGRGWTTTDPEGEAVVVNGSGVAWRETRGATRYTYVETDDGGRWLDETTQVHDGAYLGTRYHLRLYQVGEGEDAWPAVQAHREHWDWFRLRHTVGSVARGQYAVEHEFYGTGLLQDVSRERFGNGGAVDADGWVTVVDLVDWKLRTEGLAHLAAALGGVGLVGAGATGVGRWERARLWLRRGASRTRANRDAAATFLVLAAVPPVVRTVALAVERSFPAVSPKVIAAPLYLVLAVGLPAVAVVLGRRLAADEAFAAAAVGLGAGLLADYALLGITSLPLGVVVHRLALLLGIGLVAAGGVRWAETPLLRHHYRTVGLVVWVTALVWPLAGL